MAFDLTILLSAELHDVKNLMQTLSDSHDELAEELKDNPDCQQRIDKIKLHIQNLNHRLVELLSILKLQNPDFNSADDEHWLIDTLTPLIHEFELLMDLKIQADFDTDFNGFYDEQLVEIALRNIFTNAHRAGAKKVKVELEEFDDGRWILSLSDDGPGFKSEHLQQTEFHPEGAQSGLGLYLIQQAIGAHNRAGKCGKMKLSNQPNGGAVTQLVFP